MTWWRWRRYVELASGIGLQNNFISRSHYLTLELLGYAGILHQLVLYLSFPDLDINEYNLRNTGNRSIEAMHSVLRGVTANLPITSANLTYQDFLSRLNKVNQIKKAEHSLQMITGNYICSTKKHQITFAKSSGEESVHENQYEKPACYSTFVAHLIASCEQGDLDSNALLEELAPRLVSLLKKHKQWENPNLCLSTTKGSQESLPAIMEAVELHEAFTLLSDNTIDALIEYSLSGTADTSKRDLVQESDALDKTEVTTGISGDPDQVVFSNDMNDECQASNDMNDNECQTGQASNDMSDNECHGDLANSNQDADTDVMLAMMKLFVIF